MSTLGDKLNKIRSPKLQNQKETAVVLNAVEETLKSQKYGASPTAYFAALLSLLSQAMSPATGIVNKELATSVVYLLDLIANHVPAPLLKSKFEQILQCLAPVLTNHEIEAPLMRSSIGCLESLLLAQDSAAWCLPAHSISPRRVMAGLLVLAQDHRPKVRKRAQDAITNVLKSPPPSPSLDHPAADMCAESALKAISHIMAASTAAGRKSKRDKRRASDEHQPGMVHALQLVKTIAVASAGWPTNKIEGLCDVLMQVSRSHNEWLTMTAFDIFEVIFNSMAGGIGSNIKLPHLMRVMGELKPGQNDERLLPPWIAILSRGYDVLAQVEPVETFEKILEPFDMVSSYLTSSSHNIRISASECLVSLLSQCMPKSILRDDISEAHRSILHNLAESVSRLLTVKYQTAWMEIFSVTAAAFQAYRWRGPDHLGPLLQTVGELRENESFHGKKEADVVIASAVAGMGPEAVLHILPLNLDRPSPGQPGRAWLLPIVRDNVQNTTLAHFKQHMLPMSESILQKVGNGTSEEKTMETKIFETLAQQIWACLPGYCSWATDVYAAFDQPFAETLANVLYQHPDLRTNICKALQLLVETNQDIIGSNTSDGPEATEDEIFFHYHLTKAQAQMNIHHLATFAGNLLAVLFNIYSQTLPQYRGYILQCINAYLSITPEKELLETFSRVTAMMETALQQSDAATIAKGDGSGKGKEKGKGSGSSQQTASISSMPPETHTLMDLLITLSVYLPRSCFPALFTLAAQILPRTMDAQLQKKAYKLLPRLATSQIGLDTLKERNGELQTLLLQTASSVSAPARRDRLAATAVLVDTLPSSDLHFIPSILSETVIACKEVNEKARTAAFDLLVAMARKMSLGGTIDQSRIPHMDSSAPIAQASLEEFFTMVSAGLVGSTPHMVSASITALTRITYEFVHELSASVLQELVQTMDLFLTSKNREIVRSVLGFVKVTIISLPDTLVKDRLSTLVPGLMGWSKEHKSHFRAKVKHILERAIRRFGVDLIDRYCPEEDKKLIQAIRKARERRKRKKDANATGASGASGAAEDDGMEDDVDAERRQRRKGRFESEYDQALYGSDSSDIESSSSIGEDNDIKRSSSGRNRRNQDDTYITETQDEPLDLLDRRSLANISNQKPGEIRVKKSRLDRTGSKMDLDGKLVLDDEEENDGRQGNRRNHSSRDITHILRKKKSILDPLGNGGYDGDDNDNDMDDDDEDDASGVDDGVGAYVDAISGRDAVQRGRGGRLKFSNKRDKPVRRDSRAPAYNDDAMDVDVDVDVDGPNRDIQNAQNCRLGSAGQRSDTVSPRKVRFADDTRDGHGASDAKSRNGSEPGRGRGRGQGQGRGRGSGRGGSRGRAASFSISQGGRREASGGIAKRSDRRPLGASKIRGGRVSKPGDSMGHGRSRGRGIGRSIGRR